MLKHCPKSQKQACKLLPLMKTLEASKPDLILQKHVKSFQNNSD